MGAPEPDAASPLSKKQIRVLNKICRKPETWQPLEDEQKDVAKESLIGMSESLTTFFTKIGEGVKEADALLGGYDKKELSDDQVKAIKAYAMKAIEAPPHTINKR